MKQISRYITHQFTTIEVGNVASVYTINHPLLGNDFVTTSNVTLYEESTGIFHTKNTVYIPQKGESND